MASSYPKHLHTFFEILSRGDSGYDSDEIESFHGSMNVSSSMGEPPPVEVTSLDLTPTQYAAYLREKAERLKDKQAKRIELELKQEEMEHQ